MLDTDEGARRLGEFAFGTNRGVQRFTKNILFDAGSLNRSNVGARTVLPFLDAIGIDRLYAIVISHGDIDHLNGIPEIVERRRVDHIYANEAFLARSQTRGTARRLIDPPTLKLRVDSIPASATPENDRTRAPPVA